MITRWRHWGAGLIDAGNTYKRTFCYRVAVILVACIGFVSLTHFVPPTHLISEARAAEVERFGDWEVICVSEPDVNAPDASAPKANDASGANTSPRCRMVQNHIVRPEDGGASETVGQSVLLMTILAQDGTSKSAAPVAIVSVPQGVYLAPGIEIRVDAAEKFKLLYETCNASGCHAGFKLDGRIVRAFKRGAVAHHKIFNHKQKPIEIPVSLKGFTKGLERLTEVSR